MAVPWEILTPVAGEVGIGAVGGFLVGYALKKIAKVVAVILGLGFLILQYLAYKGIIVINYDALQDWVLHLLGLTEGTQSTLVDILSHIPFGASFALGLYIGFKRA
ncbi:MAG: hypothetical protein AYL28_000910 [Candidatus Bathyarchaeota archaeon B23]|nr:MAG: hypothetical protein AYL28_000910 [Candidatus Bathyarchaeota archaeon B23]